MFVFTSNRDNSSGSSSVDNTGATRRYQAYIGYRSTGDRSSSGNRMNSGSGSSSMDNSASSIRADSGIDGRSRGSSTRVDPRF